jgi:hypothetical protein
MSSKSLVALIAALSLAALPAAAGAKLDYSKNAASGQYAPPVKVTHQINDVSTPTAGTPVAQKTVTPIVVHSGPGFSWGDALIGAAVALMLALGGFAVARRRHPTPLAS